MPRLVVKLILQLCSCWTTKDAPSRVKELLFYPEHKGGLANDFKQENDIIIFVL